MSDSNLAARIERLEAAKLGRPPMGMTLSALPPPPLVSETNRAMAEAKRAREAQLRSIAEDAEAHRLALVQLEDERRADEERIRAERNAPAISRIDRQIEAIRDRQRPLEAQVAALETDLHRLEAERHALEG